MPAKLLIWYIAINLSFAQLFFEAAAIKQLENESATSSSNKREI